MSFVPTYSIGTGNFFADYLLGYPASVFRAYPLALYGNNGSEWATFLCGTLGADLDESRHAPAAG